MRISLNENVKITLQEEGRSKTFHIDKVLGTGATSIVYDAHFIDANGYRHNCRLKECCPCSIHVSREDRSVVWDNEQLKENTLRRFSDAHYRLLELQSEETLGNTSVHVSELLEGNGTIYSVMDVDFGHSYDLDTNNNLHDILNVVLLLTKVTSRIHKAGYLHLDLKPSNFLIAYEPTLMLRLFDVDSLTKIADLAARNVPLLSYSKQWASPEQIMGNWRTISPASDVYSLGAILFTRIMGRGVTNDDIGLFPSWQFDNDLFEDVNPAIKRILRDIFKKTLAATPKCRYQTADELAVALQAAVDVTTDGKPFLVSNFAGSTCEFVGRKSEITNIRAAFRAKKKAVFLHGVGGIGKSELAKKYAETYQAEYDAIIFTKYTGSLCEIIEDIEIQNFTGTYQEHTKQLRKLLSERILIIVDNFDVATDADDYLFELLRFNAHFLFTSRTDFAGVLSGTVDQIEIGALPFAHLEQIFLNHCGKQVLLLDELAALKEIIKISGGHTYFVELIARQIRASGTGLTFLLNKISLGLSSFENTEKVSTTKDDVIAKQTVLSAFRVLFNVSGLSEIQTQVLRNLYLLQSMFLPISAYRNLVYADSEEINAINDLIELGWIKPFVIDNAIGVSYLDIHPLILEVIGCDLKPSVENCKKLAENMARKLPSIDDFDYSVGEESATEAEISHNYNQLLRFSCKLDLTVEANVQFVLGWAKKCIKLEPKDEDYDEYDFKETIGSNLWPGCKETLSLLEQLVKTLELGSSTCEDQFDGNLLLLVAQIIQLRLLFYDERAKQERDEKLKIIYNQAIAKARTMPSAKEAVKDICLQCIAYLQNYYITDSKIFVEMVHELCEYMPELFLNLSTFHKEKYGFPLNEKDKALLSRENERAKRASETITEEDILRERDSKYVDKFLSSADRCSFIYDEIVNNSEFSAYTKVRLIDCCMEYVFDRLHFGTPYDLKGEYNLTRLRDILRFQESMFDSDELQGKVTSDRDEGHYYQTNEVNQIIIYALLGEEEWFKVYMDSLLDKTIEIIELAAYSNFEIERNWYATYFRMAMKALCAIDCHHLLVEYMIRYTKFWEEAINAHNRSTRALYSLYNDVAVMACAARDKVGEKTVEGQNFDRIASEYSTKADKVIGTDILFKS